MAYRARPFSEVRVGLPAWIASLSNNHGFWYGVASVIAAVILGFGIDLLAALIFGKRRKSAH
jgi:hypothetical protein